MKQRRRTNSSNKGPKSDGRFNKSKRRRFEEDLDKAENYTGKSKGRRDDLRQDSNDPSWYAQDPALLRDAASIPFSWATGTPFDLNVRTAPMGGEAPELSGMVVPGICTLYLQPTFGYAENSNDAVNVAATSLYSYVRHANSGSKNYDSPDLMMYCMAMTSIYSYINYLQRAYGVAMLYAQKNRYLPDALLRAMLIDPSIQNNLAQFRYMINLFVNKAASLAVPAVFSIFSRQAFIYQNIYCEGTSIKDQLYMYVPDGFFVYDEANNALRYSRMSKSMWGISKNAFSGTLNTSDTLFNLDDLTKIGNEMLNAILGSESFNIMSGDILKAYGDSGIVKLAALNEDYTIVPVFDIAVLEQIKNAKVVRSRNPLDFTLDDINVPFVDHLNYSWGNEIGIVHHGVITQDTTTNVIKCRPCLDFSDMSNVTENSRYVYQSLLHRNQILTTTTEDTSPALIMENSRLMCATTLEGVSFNPPETSRTAIPINKIGSEMCVGAAVWKYNDQAELKAYSLNSELTQIWTATYEETKGSKKVSYPLILAALASQFKFMPSMIIWMITILSSDKHVNIDDYIYFGNLDNYAVIDPQTLGRIHDTAVMSMLHIDSIGKIQG